MYTYTPQFNDDKQRAGGVLFPLKTTGAETHFIWIWMTVLCRHDLIFQLLVYFFTLTIFHLEHLTSDQTKAKKIASLAWGVVGAVYPSAHWYRWSIKRKHLCNSEIGRTGYHSDELWSYPAGKILITFPLYMSVHQITYLLNVTFCRWPDFMSLTLLVDQEPSGMLDQKINIITGNQSILLRTE